MSWHVTSVKIVIVNSSIWNGFLLQSISLTFGNISGQLNSSDNELLIFLISINFSISLVLLL